MLAYDRWLKLILINCNLAVSTVEMFRFVGQAMMFLSLRQIGATQLKSAVEAVAARQLGWV